MDECPLETYGLIWLMPFWCVCVFTLCVHVSVRVHARRIRENHKICRRARNFGPTRSPGNFKAFGAWAYSEICTANNARVALRPNPLTTRMEAQERARERQSERERERVREGELCYECIVVVFMRICAKPFRMGHMNVTSCAWHMDTEFLKFSVCCM